MRQLHGIAIVFFVVLSIAVTVPTFAGDASDAVNQLLHAYRRSSIEGMLAVYADDAVFEDVNQRHHVVGHDALAAMMQKIFALHRSIGLEEKRRVARGNDVVVEYDYVGTLSGEALSHLSGKSGCPDLDYKIATISWYTVRNGKVVEQRDFIDYATYKELQAALMSDTARLSPDK